MPAHTLMGALVAIAAIFVALLLAPAIFKTPGSTGGFIPTGTKGLV
jgi:hypothetical protein